MAFISDIHHNNLSHSNIHSKLIYSQFNFIFQLLIVMYLTTDPYPNLSRSSTEECFYDPDKSEYIKLKFGLTERPEKELSVIIPAYNEVERRRYN